MYSDRELRITGDSETVPRRERTAARLLRLICCLNVKLFVHVSNIVQNVLVGGILLQMRKVIFPRSLQPVA